MRNRTADLYNAIVALYQLSYDPAPASAASEAALERERETSEALGSGTSRS